VSRLATGAALVTDQAALQGLINRVHALGLELLDVHFIAEPTDDDLAWLTEP
jgi:hypothetical protein